MNNYTTDLLGYDRSLTKQSIFYDISHGQALNIQNSIPNYFSDRISPVQIASGEMVGNLNMVKGYLQSSNFQSGVNGWKFDAVGNLEANTGTFRGSIYASSGLIGGWVVDDDGLYYSGSGTPYIKTSANVGIGNNGVLLDKNGIKVYDNVLGVVVNLPSDGSAPTFASGTINETTFEVSTNAVLRTSETVGDGSANSAGILINNSGLYGCEANQTLAGANFKITNAGDAFFTGTIDASTINSSEINSASINGSTITGGLLRTAASGNRVEINSAGISLLTGTDANSYNSFKYNEATYGTGVLAYINNTSLKIPFYVESEQSVGDLHLYNRSAEPTGKAEVGDLCVVNGNLSLCVSAGTPGTWTTMAMPGAVVSSGSPSISPSLSPSVSLSTSPSVSLSVSPSVSPS